MRGMDIPAPSDTAASAPAPRFSLADFDYALPQALIAQAPPAQRTASRLLHLSCGSLSDKVFSDLPGLLDPGDLLVMNDTRVIRARLLGMKDSGGKIEALVERVLAGNEVLAQVRASKTPRPGSGLAFERGLRATVLGREGEFFRLRLESGDGHGDDAYALLERHGHVPLPPYITHADAPGDAERYQTVYARSPGAVAAPTAGLHFDQPLLDAIAARGVSLAWVTLHVGAGTFQPVRDNDLAGHRMHAERYVVPQAAAEAIARTRAAGGRVIAVGTTCVRTLESAAALNEEGSVSACDGDTRLFIQPGYEFRVVDRLITNFHLPRSTLMMLVSAFAGMEPIRRAYRHAVEQRYRFFSYGDAMLIDRDPGGQ